MIGQTLAHFEITEQLGEGGMGTVYRGRDTRLGRDVAIKVLPPEVTGDPDRLARFEREAQVIASLNHPNICALYDVGTEGEIHYLVMELVEGESLADRIGRGVTTDEALRLAIQIAEALEAAHASGIVHRDLKPANVMLTVDGQAKVLDFGLAKAWAGPTEASPSLTQSPTLTANMTQAGMILGTAAYMSPEQARGDEADQRADVWSWGVIFYEMLTGQQLFEEPTVSDTLAAVLRADLDLDSLPPDTPRGVRIALRRALERDPRNRLHAIADARLELTSTEEEVGSEQAEIGSTGASGRSALWIGLALAVIGLVAGIAGWVRSPKPTEQEATITSVPTGNVRNASLSPDGRRVFIERGGSFFARDLDSLTETELPGVDDAFTRYGFVLSPEGDRLAFTTASAIYTTLSSGGLPIKVCDVPGRVSNGNVIGLAFYEGSLVFGLDARGLWRVPLSGGEPEQILAPDREAGEAGFHHPSVHPDGQTLVARLRYFQRPNDTIVFLRNGERFDLRFDDWHLGTVRVASSGHLLFTRHREDAGVWAVPFSLDTLETTGDPVRLLAGSFGEISLGEGGSFLTLAAGQASAETVRMDRRGDVLEIFEGIGYSRSPAVSPDGMKLASMGIRVHDGQRVVRLGQIRGSRSTWSPDSREVIFEEGGASDRLFRALADGSRDPVQITEISSQDPHWSPDGLHVAFASRVDLSTEPTARQVALGETSQADILVLTLDGSSPRPFRDTEALEVHPRFSPDGQFMAYTSTESGRAEVYVTNFPEGDRRWQVSSGGGSHPRWGPDGKEIFYVGSRNLMVAGFDGAGEVVIEAPELVLAVHEHPVSFEEFGSAAYDVAPDGSLVVLRFDEDPDQAVLLVQNWLGLLGES